MKLQVSTINEFPFYPNIAGNLELDKKQRFTIILKRVNPAIEGVGWFKDNYETMDNRARLKSYIKRIENAPTLQIDDTNTERSLTVEDLLNDAFPELFSIITDLNNMINKMEQTGSHETKKS